MHRPGGNCHPGRGGRRGSCALSDEPYRDYQQEDAAARDQATVANVLMVSGGLVAAAVLYLVLQPAVASRSAATLRIGPGGVGLGGRFP